VADIASDPQLEARGFFQSVAGSAERFCGSFAVIDGVRPPLRYFPGEPLASHSLDTTPPCGAEIDRHSEETNGRVGAYQGEHA